MVLRVQIGNQLTSNYVNIDEGLICLLIFYFVKFMKNTDQDFTNI